jgi:hypothetical protein
MSRQTRRLSLVLAILAAGLAGCGALSSSSPISTPLDHSVDVDPKKTPPGVISYVSKRGNPAHGGSVEDSVDVRTAQDLDKLRGAPDDFKAFILREISVRSAEVDARL